MEVLMNFVYKNAAYCINCDWLQYSVHLWKTEPDFNEVPGYRIEMCQGTNVFKHRAIVWDNQGRKVLTLCWTPYSSKLNPLLMTCQVGNEELYIGGMQKSLELLKQITRCQFNSMGRLDFCCDFEANDLVLQRIKDMISNNIYVERKSEGSVFWHQRNIDGHKHNEAHCISWGSKKSEIKVKLYNKSREIGLLGGTDPEKPWIKAQWELVGLDVTKVWRLEFSMRTNGVMRWKDDQIRLEMLESPTWLAKVYFDLYHSRFVTRYNQGRKAATNKDDRTRKNAHKNLDKRVYLIELPTEGEKLHWGDSGGTRCESQPAVKYLRALINQVENQAVLSNTEILTTLCRSIEDTTYKLDLVDYFEHTFGKPVFDWTAEILQAGGEGIKAAIVSPSKLMS